MANEKLSVAGRAGHSTARIGLSGNANEWIELRPLAWRSRNLPHRAQKKTRWARLALEPTPSHTTVPIAGFGTSIPSLGHRNPCLGVVVGFLTDLRQADPAARHRRLDRHLTKCNGRANRIPRLEFRTSAIATTLYEIDACKNLSVISESGSLGGTRAKFRELGIIWAIRLSPSVKVYPHSIAQRFRPSRKRKPAVRIS